MKILDVIQGSPDWHQARAKHFRTASKAPALMGASKYQSRAEMLKEVATGITPEVDGFKQALFDRGHLAEATARQIAEAHLQDELYPTTATDDYEYLLASFDGLTMNGLVAWEHKLYNEELAEAVRNKDLPAMYYWQLEQQLLISNAERVMFMVSDGTRENCVWMDYYPVKGRKEALLAGWKQFDEDLAYYQHQEVIPAAVAAPIEDLPALNIAIDGRVLSSNLTQWQSVVTDRIKSINTMLSTDADFATAEKTVKFLDEGEKKLDLVKSQAQSQAADIDALFRAIDNIKAEMRTKRLELDKLVKSRKEAIRSEILQEALKAFKVHIESLNARLGKQLMPVIANQFGEVMKGKKTVQSLRDAVSTELARLKIEANQIADMIQVNLNAYNNLATGYEFLFHDLDRIINQPPESFGAVVENRINKYAKELAEKKAAENPLRKLIRQRPRPPSLVVQRVVDTGERINLSEINARLAPISITADGLATLGFKPVSIVRPSKLYRATDWLSICEALAVHVQSVRSPRKAA